MARAGKYTVKGMVNSESAFDRADFDFYPTPPDVPTALLDRLALDPDAWTMIEPCCGTGDMAAVLEAYGFETYASDLNDMCYGHRANIFDTTGYIGTNGKQVGVVTNPPFDIAEDIIRHLSKIKGVDMFALVLKATYWHAKGRLDLYNKFRPTYVWPLTWRPAFLEAERGSSPIQEIQICVWFPPAKNKFVSYHEPLRRPTNVPALPLKVLMAKNKLARRQLDAAQRFYSQCYFNGVRPLAECRED